MSGGRRSDLLFSLRAGELPSQEAHNKYRSIVPSSVAIVIKGYNLLWQVRTAMDESASNAIPHHVD